MLLLAIDTSARPGGITLARGDAEQCEILESAIIEGGTFSAELIPQISDLLRRHGFEAVDLEALVAVTGPGSFTGLRVGLAAVKALAEALGLPIVTVTSLELLLAATRQDNCALAVLDAGRGEVYIAFQDGNRRQESLMPVGEAAEQAKARNACVAVVEPALAKHFDTSELVSYSSSEMAARLGLLKLLRGETVDVVALDANYIRKSEAEYLQKLGKRNKKS